MTNLRRDPLTWQYPALDAYRQEWLQVSKLHSVYVEESGNPKGKPVIFVHGGPGGGTSPSYRQFFDPDRYRIILFDQRGCGKSTPHACLEENSTWDLVVDMETIRQHLKIDKWQVFGGSWGSTLGLAYAVTHPDRVTELVLRGIFLGTKREVDWLYQFGASEIFPDAWEAYRDQISPAERPDFLSAYHRRLTSDDKAVQLAAAKTWSGWEGRITKLLPDAQRAADFEEDQFAIAFARIENHFFVNKCFFKDDHFLLSQAPRLHKIPGVIVHGRYDMCCPIRSAFDLHAVWKASDLIVVPDAGHAAFEPGISKALVAATDRFAGR